MIRIVFTLLVMLTTFSLEAQSLKWNIRHPQTGKWIPLGEKGSVQEALINSGYLPDPFVSDNEKLFQWIEQEEWTFESVFELNAIDPAKSYDLDFPSIDTYGKVYLNGVLCGTGENSFVHYRFQVTHLLKPGKNTVKVVFTSPVNAKKKEAQAFTYPAPNDVGVIKVAPYCRKPQYQFGWDWSLRMPTMGFWEPASLVSYESSYVIGKTVVTAEIEESVALQQFILYLGGDLSEQEYVWESDMFGALPVGLSNGRISRYNELKNPILWWPRGQGDQHLYTDVWTLKTLDGKIIYHDTIQFGVRTSQVVQEKDEWGTSFVIKVNGRPMFCKGADYIPDDIFPARITAETLRDRVQTMADCNFNMVRIWGGGMYAREEFLDACDQLGIMVWHDFMFACAMYPANDAFLKNVKNELDQQVPRIAAHPSVVYFNGNNEVDVAWKNWGFQDQYKISKTNQNIIQADYDKLFKQFIPETIRNYTNLPYVHTSPLSNWGNDDFYNHGTQHYWGVWHGQDPMSNMGTKIGRFNAEYGFQSFPEYSTLLKFSTPNEWQLDSKVMKQHQKSYVGNAMIAKHSDLLYGKAKTFEDFIYYSQLTQAEAVETAVNAHRIDKPRCSGTLFWQLNDCWPAISWSSIDYYDNWKALQYRVRESYADVAIVKDKTSGKCSYYLVSDIPNGYNCAIQCKVSDVEGKELATFHCHRAVTDQSIAVFEQELAAFDHQFCVVEFTWDTPDGKQTTITDVHYGTTYYNPNKTIVLKDLTIDESTKTGTITVVADALIEDFWIYSLTQGIHFENNFLILQRGTHTLQFQYAKNIPNLKDFKYKNR